MYVKNESRAAKVLAQETIKLRVYNNGKKGKRQIGVLLVGKKWIKWFEGSQSTGNMQKVEWKELRHMFAQL